MAGLRQAYGKVSRLACAVTDAIGRFAIARPVGECSRQRGKWQRNERPREILGFANL
jgi:hypothetical protein